MIHPGLMRPDLGDAHRIDSRNLEDEEQIAAEAHHLAPVARHDGSLFLRIKAEAIEIGTLVLLEGLAVGRMAQPHRHFVDAVPAERPLAVEERSVWDLVV